jgi:hypothetical protein
MRKRKHAYRVLVVKLVIRPLGRPSRRWEDNIKKDIREQGWDMD